MFKSLCLIGLIASICLAAAPTGTPVKPAAKPAPAVKAVTPVAKAAAPVKYKVVADTIKGTKCDTTIKCTTFSIVKYDTLIPTVDTVKTIKVDTVLVKTTKVDTTKTLKNDFVKHSSKPDTIKVKK